MPESVLVESAISPRDLLKSCSDRTWKPYPLPEEKSFKTIVEDGGIRVEVEPYSPYTRWFVRLCLSILVVGPLLFVASLPDVMTEWWLIPPVVGLLWFKAYIITLHHQRFGRVISVRRDGLLVKDETTWFGEVARWIPASEIVSLRIDRSRKQLDPVGLKDYQQELVIDDGCKPVTVGPGVPWLPLAWLRRLILAVFFPASKG